MKDNLINSNDKPVIVLGSGNHAKVLINTLKKCGRVILGVTDPYKEIGEDCYDVKILGDDHIIFEYSINEIELINSVAGLDKKELRLKLKRNLEDKGYIFSKVIHPSAIIADGVILSDGVQIMAGAILQPGVKIGHSSIINTGAIIDHDCVIHDDCHIAPGVTLNGNVVIGERSHVGTGTSVIENKKIGQDCIIAAGSIIYHDISANTKFMQPRKKKVLI